MRDEKRTSLTIDPRKDKGPFEGIVRNVLDPKLSGSLEIELIKTIGSNNFSTGQIVVARYLHPFYGTTPISNITDDSGNETADSRNSQQSYGMWFVPPDVGNHVMVTFIEGNWNRAFWMGCINQFGMNFGVPESNVATSTVKTTDAELTGKKLPVSEYNKSNRDTIDITRVDKIAKPVNIRFKNILANQGLLEDETRGLTTTSSRREVPSSVFGINTPGPVDKEFTTFSRLGGTSLVMDDGDSSFVRKTSASEGPSDYVNLAEPDESYFSKDKQVNIPHNELFRIRTRTGHQILLHNSEDLIYIANANGTAWIEMTANGKIDFFAQDSVSIHTQTDFNFKADRDINLEAGRSINLKARSSLTEETLGSHTVTVGTNQTITVANLQTVSVGTTNHYATGNINQDTGGVINLNNGFAVETPPTPLSTHENPGESYGNIMKRIPQHEPWTHHENFDPQAVSTAKTDRTTIEQVTPGSPTNIPDTFRNGKV